MEEDTFDVDAANLSVLRRDDPAVASVVERADHVTVYSWDEASQAWRKENVQGCLLIARRRAPPPPAHRFFVLNRASPRNMAEDVTADLRVEAADPGPYLLYRTPVRTVGLWFVSSADRDRCVSCIRALVAEECMMPPAAPAAASLVSAAEEADDEEDDDDDEEEEDTAVVPDLGLLQISPARPTAVQPHQQPQQQQLRSSTDALGMLQSFFRPGPPQQQPQQQQQQQQQQQITVTKEQLSAALVRLAQNDAFLDMLIAELANRP